MNILIVEDDPNKLKRIRDFLDGLPFINSIAAEISYKAGLRRILSESFDLVLQDMTMPNYDPGKMHGDESLRFLAGRDVLMQLDERNVEVPIVIVTQFEEFGAGADKISLEDLSDQLRVEFPKNYIASVFYSSVMPTWQDEIRSLLGAMIKK